MGPKSPQQWCLAFDCFVIYRGSNYIFSRQRLNQAISLFLLLRSITYYYDNTASEGIEELQARLMRKLLMTWPISFSQDFIRSLMGGEFATMFKRAYCCYKFSLFEEDANLVVLFARRATQDSSQLAAKFFNMGFCCRRLCSRIAVSQSAFHSLPNVKLLK